MESSFKIQKSIIPKLYESESLFRCSECLFIPFIKIIFENGKIYIETKCENSHLNKIEINNYLKTINSYNIKCYSCKKNNIELNYWPEENKFFCNNCKKKINEKCINSNKFDSKCKKDFKDYSEFCEKCFQNQCIYCFCSHNINDKIKCNPNIININEINKMKETLINGKRFIDEIENEAKNIYEKCLQTLNNDIKIFRENNQSLIYLYEKILDCYIYHKENKNLNYQIIENVKNILKFKDFQKKPSIHEFFDLSNYLILDNIKFSNNKKENEKKISKKNIIDSLLKKNSLNTNYTIKNILNNNIIKPQIQISNNDFFNYLKIKDKNQKIPEIKLDKSKEEKINIDKKKEKKDELIMTINEQNSSETLSITNENDFLDEYNQNNNIKSISIETTLPIIIKINSNISKEKISKISSQIYELKKNIKIPKNLLEEIFKEYPPININKNLNITTVYNKEYEKEKSIYSGEINILTGQKEGRGIILYKNGDYRLGYFHKDKQIKKGIQYHIQEESWYEGNFINDSQEGYGEIYWNDYEYFIGNFKNSQLSHGEYFYNDGRIYKGPFLNGKKNGLGEYFNPINNSREKVLFKNDNIVSKSKGKFKKK